MNYITIAENLANDGSYSWTVPSIDTSSMLVKITAFDTVGNFASDTSNATFITDATAPSLAFSYTNTPPNGVYINNSGIDITGSTSDTYFSELRYKFQDVTSSTFYDGSSYTGAESWVTVCTDGISAGTSGACDSIAFSISPSITDGNNYILTLSSTDEAGNQTDSVELSYTGDTTNPSLTIATAS